MNKTVNVAELKDNLTGYLALAESGQQVIVCRRNVPIVRIEGLRRPVESSTLKMFGCMKGTITFRGDLTEPCIPEQDWEMLK